MEGISHSCGHNTQAESWTLLGHPCAHASGLRQARKGSILPHPCTGARLAQRDMDRPRECWGHESFLSTHITQAQLQGLLLVPQTTDVCQAGTQSPVSAAAAPSLLCSAQLSRLPFPSLPCAAFSPLGRPGKQNLPGMDGAFARRGAPGGGLGGRGDCQPRAAR